MRVNRITPNAVDAFERGDGAELHRALDLRPWEPSPLDTDADDAPAWMDAVNAERWRKVRALRIELEGGASRPE